MLTFRNTNIFFALIVVALIAANFFIHVSLVIYIAILLSYSFILFYGSYFIEAGFYIKSICAASTQKKQIAISFDDGPAENFTPQVLEILRAENVEAAFFCIGKRINGNEQILQSIAEQGHIIGNHSFSHHFWFDLFSSKKMLADLRQMNESVKNTIGKSPRLFRPPYGVTNPNLKKAILQGNYISIGWNIRSMDTVIDDEKKLLQKISSAMKPGAIVLFHDTSKTTLNILQDFIRYVKGEGYEIIRLDKMCNLQAYE